MPQSGMHMQGQHGVGQTGIYGTTYGPNAASQILKDVIQMDLGQFKLEFINGRWKEQDQKMTTAKTIEDENRELNAKIRGLNSENNMLKYRNEVLMQMLTVAKLDLEKYNAMKEDAVYNTGDFGAGGWGYTGAPNALPPTT